MSTGANHGPAASTLLEDLTLFYREMSPPLARVLAYLPGAANDSIQLTGHLYGPHNWYASTLASKHEFHIQPCPTGRLAQSVVTDPCYWSPELPSLYELHLHLKRGSDELTWLHANYGLRTLRAWQQQLLWENRRWVLRGVRTDHLVLDDLDRWRKLAAVAIVEEADEDLIQWASMAGIALAVHVPGNADLESTLRQWGRHPSVIAALLPATAELPENVRQLAPNLLLGQLDDGRRESPAEWAQVVFSQVTDERTWAARVQRWATPVVAIAERGVGVSLEEARTRCDRLQARLAPYGQFAGYVG